MKQTHNTYVFLLISTVIMYPFNLQEESNSRYEYLRTLGIDAPLEQKELLMTAFIHKSFAADRSDRMKVSHNERLEFLGDAVLGCCVSGLLYNDFPDESEAQLTLSKIYLVKESTLAYVARTITLGAYVLLGYGEDKSGGRDKDSVLSDTLEAVIGYLYLAYGAETVESFVKKHIYSLLQGGDLRPAKSYKSLLQELVQKHRKEIPEYHDEILEQEESGNVLLYSSRVSVHTETIATGVGPSKKKAQEEAAEQAYTALVERMRG